jgi:putative transposase
LKPVTDVERCQCRKAVALRGHIGLALRAFLVVEMWCFRTGVNGLSAKWQIVRDAVRAYRARPHYRMPNTATA